MALSSSSAGAKRRIPGTLVGGERVQNPIPEKVARVEEIDIYTPERHGQNLEDAFEAVYENDESQMSDKQHRLPPEVTLDAIAGLLKSEITPVQQSMQSLDKKMQDLTISVDERLKVVESRLDGSEARIAKLEELLKVDRTTNDRDQLWEEVQALKGQINEAKVGAKELNDMEITAVIGGLGALRDADHAWWWVNEQLWNLHGPQPTEVYCKVKFGGVAFAKFANKYDRDQAIKL